MITQADVDEAWLNWQRYESKDREYDYDVATRLKETYLSMKKLLDG